MTDKLAVAAEIIRPHITPETSGKPVVLGLNPPVFLGFAKTWGDVEDMARSRSKRIFVTIQAEANGIAFVIIT